MIYTTRKYTFSNLKDSQICLPDLECLRLEMKLPRTRPTYICCLYRLPDGSVINGLDLLTKSMDSAVVRPDCDVVIMGDINIDYQYSSPAKKALETFLKNYHLSQIIESATRVTFDTSSLIDHIYVNNRHLYWHQGTVNPGLRDHKLCYTCRKARRPDRREKNFLLEI